MDIQKGLRYVDEGKGILTFLLYERKVEGDIRNEKLMKEDRWVTVFVLLDAILLDLGF